MKYRIKFLPDAKADKDDIKAYLDTFYAGTAKRFLDSLNSKITRLKDFPYLYPTYEDDPDYRVLVIGDYLVFYVVIEDGKFVEIHRIFHGSKDISQHF